MHNDTNWNESDHLISDSSVDLHEMVENIHAGLANFSDLQIHFDNWQAAANFYATATSQRFPANKEDTTCELCCVSKDTKSHQLLFRAFLDRDWGKKVSKGFGLFLALVLPITFRLGNSRKSGVRRLIFPTHHNLCRPCKRGLKFRFFLATSLGLVITLIKFVLLVASIFGILALIPMVAITVFDEKVSWIKGILLCLLCISPITIWISVHYWGRGLEKYIRFPEKFRRISTKPFAFIPIQDSQIQEPIILHD